MALDELPINDIKNLPGTALQDYPTHPHITTILLYTGLDFNSNFMVTSTWDVCVCVIGN